MEVKTENFDFQSNLILSSLALADHKKLLNYAEEISFIKGKLLFYEESIPTGIFFIKKGKVKIYKTTLDQKDQIIYIYKRGDLFGYHALLCNERYQESCKTLEKCEMLFIRKEHFRDLLIKIPLLKDLLINNMSHEFKVLSNQITILAQKTTRERLAIYLIILNTRYDNGIKPTLIALSREDLANLMGTSRENLSRLLKEFKDCSFINIHNKGIEVINLNAIHQIAYPLPRKKYQFDRL